MTIPGLEEGRMGGIRRRDFVTLLGGMAAACPLAARAQQTVMPVVGFLSSLSLAQTAHLVSVLRQGLADAGYDEGRNVKIEYRWAEGRYDRLPALAADLVSRQVTVLVAIGPPAALALKAATPVTPIVFMSGLDPASAGLVTSFNRPAENLTGISLFLAALGAKRLELLLGVTPQADVVAMLVNPSGPSAGVELSEVRGAAQTLKRRLEVVTAGEVGDFDLAFATLVARKAAALIVGDDPFFTNSREQIVALAARHAVPAIYELREFVVSGGLLSYGPSLAQAYRQVGIYAGRILKGARPADLPVLQPTKFEFVINLQTAKALGITVPDKLLALADEVIE
jgi:putative ABC transport system substrate-binding protein